MTHSLTGVPSLAGVHMRGMSITNGISPQSPPPPPPPKRVWGSAERQETTKANQQLQHCHSTPATSTTFMDRRAMSKLLLLQKIPSSELLSSSAAHTFNSIRNPPPPPPQNTSSPYGDDMHTCQNHKQMHKEMSHHSWQRGALRDRALSAPPDADLNAAMAATEEMTLDLFVKAC